MSQTLPPRGVPWWGAALVGVIGVVAGEALHLGGNLHQLGMASDASLACQDIDAYVEQVSQLSDHRIHDTTFGIHRQKTIDAVNELYDRARCQPQRDAADHETYEKLRVKVVADVNDPGPPPAPVPALAVPAPDVAVTPSRPAVAITSRRHLSISGTLPQRTYTVVDEENQAGTPAGAEAPGYGHPKPLRCGPGPNGIDYHVTGCP